MKKLFFIITISLLFTNNAMGKSYLSTFKIAYEAALGGDVKNNLFGGEYIGDFALGKHWMLGAGFGSFTSDFQTGFSKKDEKRYSAWIIPVFFDTKLVLVPEGNFKPYILGNIGYSFLSMDANYKGDAKLGAFVNIGLGAAIKAGKGSFILETYYKKQMQDIEDKGIYLDDFSNIGVTIGYRF